MDHPVGWTEVKILMKPRDYWTGLAQETFQIISCKEAVNKDGETLPIKYEDLVSHRSQ